MHSEIIQGDCLVRMAEMEANSIDFIVTDPPYGLHFMGKDWDGRIPAIEIWAQALRVAKPGAMLAAFGGSRTHHHLMCAIEGGGWEIRDVIMWVYGSGFPKSHNHFGIPGYGTALKPSYEPIILAMKPLEGTYAQNAEKWGVAGINIDESRIESEPWNRPTRPNIRGGNYCNSEEEPIPRSNNKGRWPANIIFDEEAGAMLDEMSGNLKSGQVKPTEDKPFRGIYEHGRSKRNVNEFPASSGGASRFFYCAKASTAERNRGLEGLPLREKKTLNEYARPSEGRNAPKCGSSMQNTHPTVKPISLMKYIIKLLAPPGDPILLDPFAGSGSTLVAAKKLGIRAKGIELSEEYCEIARKRIEGVQEDTQLRLFA